MKNTVFFILFFIAFAAFGQETIHFTYEVDYEISPNEGKTEKLKAFVAPESGVVLLKYLSPYENGNLMVYQSKGYEVNVSLGNDISIKQPLNIGNSAINIVTDENYETLAKKGEGTKVKNIGCEFYSLSFGNEKYTLCIAENNSIDILSAFTPKNVESKVNGLILKMYPENEKIPLKYVSHDEIDIIINFNIEKEIKKYNEAIEKLLDAEKEENAIYDALIEASSAKDEELTTAQKAIQDGYEAVLDTVEEEEVQVYELEDAPFSNIDEAELANIFEAANGVFEYNSTFRENQGSQFAILELEKDSDLWKNIPAYCKDLDSIIPQMRNQKFQTELRNYAGQTCDMYLYDTAPNLVDFKSTLDEIRRSVEYIQKNTNKLYKKDQKAVQEFLKSLD